VADRTVLVKLAAQVEDFVAKTKLAASSARGVTDELVDTAKAAKELGPASERAAEEAAAAFKITEHAAKKLDDQIDETKRSVRDLAREIAHVSDEAARADLVAKLTKNQDKLRELTGLRKLIDFNPASNDEEAHKVGVRWGTKIAEGMTSGLASVGTLGGRVFGGLPPEAQAAIGAGIVGAGVAAAPLFGGVIAGAVVGGVGIGGVVGGLMLAAKDPAVQAAAKVTGDEFSKTMGRASAAFVPATVDALGLVRAEIRSMEGDFKHVFDGASRFVRPLTEGALGFVRELMPGIKDAIDKAGPVIDELASWGPKLGSLGSDLLSKLADHADEGAAALHMLFSILDLGVRSVGSTIEGLAVMFGWLDKINQLTGGSIVENIDRAIGGDTERKLIALRPPTDQWNTSLQATADLTRTNSTAMELWNETMKRMATEGQGAFDTATRLGAAIAKASELATHGKDTLDANTKAGRDNRNALSDLAAAGVAAAAAERELTSSQAAGQVKMDEAYVSFIKTATGMGLSKQAAHDLAVQLGLIPSPKVTVTVTTKPAITAIANVVTYLNKVDGMVATAYIKVKTIGNIDHVTSNTGGGRSINRWGGLYEHAAEGKLREAQVASPMGPARYAWAEPATGGEAFIPRIGDRARSLGILDRAAGWYGATVQPRLPRLMAAPGGGTRTVEHRHVVLIEGTGVLGGLRREIRIQGGSVQQVLGQGAA
jgi:polyhydroxyalkanoate synthesis regulator phasin